MIVGFSRHGTGGGSGPTDYVTNPKREGREESPPVTVRGDPSHTKDLIDSLDFKWKYTSGVLSFAPSEVITQKMESDIIDRFESVAFAGLEPDQYNILWVRHSHAGHHELHFITPRVELETGKSLNIKPPGERAREHFDDFRSEMNAKYGLADPTDPDREKNVSSPNHELKMVAEALRKGCKAPDNTRQLIDKILTQRAVEGLIRSRGDVLNHVKELGLKITREGKHYITVSDPNSNGRWRLKGGLYAQDFEPSTAIERADIARERDYSKPDQEAARRYGARVERHISARAEYNHSRYPRPEPAHEQLSPPHMAMGILNDNNNSHWLFRSPVVAGTGTSKERTADQPTKRTASGIDLAGWETGDTRLWRADVHSPSHEYRNLDINRQIKRNSIIHTEGVLSDDGVRNSINQHFENIRAKVQRAAQRFCSLTISFTNDVRNHVDGILKNISPSRTLEQAIGTFEQVITKKLTKPRRNDHDHDLGR